MAENQKNPLSLGVPAISTTQSQTPGTSRIIVVTSTRPQPHTVLGPVLNPYNRRAARITGIVQTIMSTLCLLFSIGLATVNYDSSWMISTGWWGALFFYPAGVLGIISAKIPSRCMIKCTLAFSILSVMCMPALATQSALALDGSCDAWTSEVPCEERNAVAHYAFATMVLLTGLLEIGAAMTQAILCCQANCECCGDYVECTVESDQNIYGNPGFSYEQNQNLAINNFSPQPDLPPAYEPPSVTKTSL